MPGLSLWSWMGPKTPPGSMVTMRIRSWRPAMPSISGPRSSADNSLTVTPLVSGPVCSFFTYASFLIFLPPMVRCQQRFVSRTRVIDTVSCKGTIPRNETLRPAPKGSATNVIRGHFHRATKDSPSNHLACMECGAPHPQCDPIPVPLDPHLHESGADEAVPPTCTCSLPKW